MVKDKFRWDSWQQEILDYDGNIALRSGRQVGKSEVIGAKGCKFALENPNTVTMVIAASQRQSSLLFEKIRGNIERLEEKGQDLFKEPPTLTKILLKNGSKIYSLPAGRTGYFIRGFTIDLLIVDEASFLPETVYNAIIPMIAVSKKVRGMGYMILLSTPFGKGGYFHHVFSDKDYKHFHVSSEDCPRIPKDLLKKEKARLTKAEYRQEWQGEFTDEWNQFFPTDLIKKSMTFIEWSKEKDHNPAARYYLGVDIARYGGDENAFVICELHKTKLKIVKCFTTDRVSTTDTIGRIVVIDKEYNFSKIFIDDAGVGGAVTDVLIERLGKRVLGLNNASRRVTTNVIDTFKVGKPGFQKEEVSRGILKEDLYSNALMLMETGKLEIISNLSLLKSLKSVIYEYTSEQQSYRRVKIYGDWTHLAEAMVRSCWCIKERGLDIYVY